MILLATAYSSIIFPSYVQLLPPKASYSADNVKLIKNTENFNIPWCNAVNYPFKRMNNAQWHCFFILCMCLTMNCQIDMVCFDLKQFNSTQSCVLKNRRNNVFEDLRFCLPFFLWIVFWSKFLWLATFLHLWANPKIWEILHDFFH